MKLDEATVRSIATGHRTMFPGHRTRPVRNGMGETVGYLCHGRADWEPCEADWFLACERDTGGEAS